MSGRINFLQIFDLTTANEKLTRSSGVIILGEYLNRLGLEKLCDSHLPLRLNHNV